MKKHYLIIAILVLASILRLVSLDKFPSGFNADEAALGYNAYSLIETGKDEHGESWPLVFRSFDDYKPPLYVYLTIPFVKIFGLNVYSVRLPSAIAGILSVWLIYLVSIKLFKDKKYLPEISAFILATSPWHLHFSRGAWEVNISTFLILLGFHFYLKSKENINYLYLFVLTFVLSLYTYHSARVIAPILGLSLVLIDLKYFLDKKNLKTALLALAVGIILALPVATQLLSKEGQSRFSGVSIFADSGPLSWVHEMRRTDPNPDSTFTKIKYNRYFAYAGKFVQNYFSHFSPNFLFVTGDKIDRSRVPGFGQMLSVTGPLALIGLINLLGRRRSKTSLLILSWLAISPVAASLTYQSPHALRSQNMVIPLTLLISLGIFQTLQYIKNSKFSRNSSIFILIAIFIYQYSQYLNSYFYRYSRELPIAWQAGFSEIASYTKENYDKYDKIIITNRYDQPYILIAFFQKYPPEKLQEELVMSERDEFGFSTGLKFGKYEFGKIDLSTILQNKNSLVVTENIPLPNLKVSKTIQSPSGEVLFNFIDTNL